MIGCIGFLCILTILNVYLFIKFPSHTRMKYDCYDVCIILGSPTSQDGRCSRMQQSRMNRAIELYKAKKIKCFIVSGGCVCNQYSEASAMKKYAISKGVLEKDILLEEQAHNTYENLLYSKKICESYDFHTVIVVTSNFHVRRASFFVHKFFTDFAMAGTFEHEKFRHYISEYFRMWNTLRIEFCMRHKQK